MYHHMLRAVEPAVSHTAREWLHGAPPIHALWQAASIGYLTGRGLRPHQAVRMVERLEAMKYHGVCPTGYGAGAYGMAAPGEAWEHGLYHGGAGWGHPDPDGAGWDALTGLEDIDAAHL